MEESFDDPAVAEKFSSYNNATRDRLMLLRQWVLEEAAAQPQCGTIVETLKWGQPAYLTEKPKSGSTIRMDAMAGEPGSVALYFICTSNLMDAFKQHYSDVLPLTGKRTIELPSDFDLPEAPLRHCIALALTYHIRKKD